MRRHLPFLSKIYPEEFGEVCGHPPGEKTHTIPHPITSSISILYLYTGYTDIAGGSMKGSINYVQHQQGLQDSKTSSILRYIEKKGATAYSLIRVMGWDGMGWDS
jgi:hypothetical protein